MCVYELSVFRPLVNEQAGRVRRGASWLDVRILFRLFLCWSYSRGPGLVRDPAIFQIVEFSHPKSSISDLKRPVIFGKTTGRNHRSPAIWLAIRRWRLTPLCLFLFETSADCALGS